MVPERTSAAIIKWFENSLSFWNVGFTLAALVVGGVLCAPVFLPMIFLNWLVWRTLVKTLGEK